MTTKGAVIHLIGSGVSQSVGAVSAIHYRGAVCFNTTSERYSKLNSIVGVYEYDVDADGNTTAKIWEWK